MSIIPEKQNKITVLGKNNTDLTNLIKEALIDDQIILIQNVSSNEADTILEKTATVFNLKTSLETQAGFASIQGHRENIGHYFMSVNSRSNFEFIPPHSEGSQSGNTQLASFYCYENTTDGGESILMNVNQNSKAWETLKEVKLKVKLGNIELTPEQISMAKMMFHINIPEDIVKDEDRILKVHDTELEGVQLVEVLQTLEKNHSVILNTQLFSYWDSVASSDFDSASEFYSLLKKAELLKNSESNLMTLEQFDNASNRRVWNSGVQYAELFNCKVTRKLQKGDLIIQNNQTWTHATNNWTPNSGKRKVAAAFA